MPSRMDERMPEATKRKILEEYDLLPRRKGGYVQMGFTDLLARKWRISRNKIYKLVEERKEKSRALVQS